MRIELKKDAGNTGTLTFIRGDGSRCWHKLTPYFAMHDLMHYCVETRLGYRNAFIGLIAAGRSVEDFEEKAKDWVPPEAVVVEAITGALQLEMAGSADPADFDVQLQAACDGLGLTKPTITTEAMNEIRAEHARLLGEWHFLPAGQTLVLTWP